MRTLFWLCGVLPEKNLGVPNSLYEVTIVDVPRRLGFDGSL
jgi:hypothetical protein